MHISECAYHRFSFKNTTQVLRKDDAFRVKFTNPSVFFKLIPIGTIYYTTDGTDPTASSEEYREPILLQNEGEVVIKAIAINDKEIPSIVSSAKYTIEFPIASAPAVNPATGQYTEPTQITITVPDGYTAYYTMDGTTPTSDSERYTGPVDMPENSQIIFNAVLINNNNGKATDVTTRNYITRAE